MSITEGWDLLVIFGMIFGFLGGIHVGRHWPCKACFVATKKQP